MILKRDDLIKLIRSGDTSDLNYVLDSFGLVKKAISSMEIVKGNF